MPALELRKLQDLLVGMKEDIEGRQLLRQLNLDGFTREDDRLFESVEKNLRFVHGG